MAGTTSLSLAIGQTLLGAGFFRYHFTKTIFRHYFCKLS